MNLFRIIYPGSTYNFPRCFLHNSYITVPSTDSFLQVRALTHTDAVLLGAGLIPTEGATIPRQIYSQFISSCNDNCEIYPAHKGREIISLIALMGF